MDDFEDIESNSSASSSASAEAADPVADPDYSEIIEEIGNLETRLDSIEDQLGVIGDDVHTLATADTATSNDGVDYSGHLEAIGQNVSLGNVILLVLAVGLFLTAGINVGNALVRWFKHER